MSWQACSWAIEQQEVTHHVARHVLLCLANYADAEGRAAFPSVLRLARDTGLSERAVQYQLRALEKAVLIRKGSRGIAAARITRGDRRPVVYDLLISRGAQDAPRSLTGCTPEQNGVHATTSRGARHAPDPPSILPEHKSAITRDQKEEFKARVRLNALASTLSQSKRLGDGKR